MKDTISNKYKQYKIQKNKGSNENTNTKYRIHKQAS